MDAEPWRALAHAPVAFAVTRSASHLLEYANDAFRRLTALAGPLVIGQPIARLFAAPAYRDVIALLDQISHEGGSAASAQEFFTDADGQGWSCAAWSDTSGNGRAELTVLELRAASPTEIGVALQKELAERLLFSSLRERDLADAAEAQSRRSGALADASRSLAASLDEQATLDVVAGLTLPQLGTWCIVDLVEADGVLRRLAIGHPDPAMQALVRELEASWTPHPSEEFGAGAVLASGPRTLLVADAGRVLATGDTSAETKRVLRELGAGPLLTVPMVARGRVLGAITFVCGRRDAVYTPDDIRLAEDLAARSAIALDSAALFREALEQRARAEAASKAKNEFLGTMSHELRTPLNAIGGYVSLIDMGLRGPVTPAQHDDLMRVRSNQEHLLVLITDILNFVKVGSGGATYNIIDVQANFAVVEAVAMVEPLLTRHRLDYVALPCSERVVAFADPERLRQILLNLLSNATKFTPEGGTISTQCEETPTEVFIRVSDTGIGIPEDRLETIFEPFVQLRAGLAGREAGVGLGLAISRDLVRAMNGDLRVESKAGEGARFTIVLPRAGAPVQVARGADAL